MPRALGNLLAQIGIAVVVACIWEWGYTLKPSLPWLVPNLLDPYFVSRPSDIARQFLAMSCLGNRAGEFYSWTGGQIGACLARSQNNLWFATLVTVRNTLAGFALGVVTGFILGLLLGRNERLAEILNPYLVAINSIPRIALAPLVLLAFGIGAMSKIVMSWMVVVFVVFFNTFEGVRQVDRDHINGARLLGATNWQITRTVVIPSAMTWLFASLSPAISFALIGVIVGEFIGAEFGIGRIIIESEARGDASAMMVAVLVLMAVGIVLGSIFQRIQSYLLRWQPTRAA
jgi:NitT/TauT family transport system permease protein